MPVKCVIEYANSGNTYKPSLTFISQLTPNERALLAPAVLNVANVETTKFVFKWFIQGSSYYYAKRPKRRIKFTCLEVYEIDLLMKWASDPVGKSQVTFYPLSCLD